MHDDFQRDDDFVSQNSNHISQLIHFKLDVFVSNLFFHSIHVVERCDVVMNFHVINAIVEHSLHDILIISNHAFVHHRDDVR